MSSNKLDAMIIMVVGLVAISNTVLILLGENRPDLYVSATILSYFIAYAMSSPDVRPPIIPRIVNAILLCLFLIIVAFRVYGVLAK